MERLESGSFGRIPDEVLVKNVLANLKDDPLSLLGVSATCRRMAGAAALFRYLETKLQHENYETVMKKKGEAFASAQLFFKQKALKRREYLQQKRIEQEQKQQKEREIDKFLSNREDWDEPDEKTGFVNDDETRKEIIDSDNETRVEKIEEDNEDELEDHEEEQMDENERHKKEKEEERKYYPNPKHCNNALVWWKQNQVANLLKDPHEYWQPSIHPEYAFRVDQFLKTLDPPTKHLFACPAELWLHCFRLGDQTERAAWTGLIHTKIRSMDEHTLIALGLQFYAMRSNATLVRSNFGSYSKSDVPLSGHEPAPKPVNPSSEKWLGCFFGQHSKKSRRLFWLSVPVGFSFSANHCSTNGPGIKDSCTNELGDDHEKRKDVDKINRPVVATRREKKRAKKSRFFSNLQKNKDTTKGVLSGQSTKKEIENGSSKTHTKVMINVVKVMEILEKSYDAETTVRCICGLRKFVSMVPRPWSTDFLLLDSPETKPKTKTKKKRSAVINGQRKKMGDCADIIANTTFVTSSEGDDEHFSGNGRRVVGVTRRMCCTEDFFWDPTSFFGEFPFSLTFPNIAKAMSWAWDRLDQPWW